MFLRQAWSIHPAPWVRRLLSLAFVGAAAVLIYRQLAAISMTAFLASLTSTGPGPIVASILLTVASYLCLAGTEWTALHALAHPLSFRQAALVAIPAYALTNSAGFSPATGTALRLQLYGRRGLSAGQSAAVAMLAGGAVSLSGIVTAGLLFVAAPSAFGAAFHGPAWGVIAIGAVLIFPVALWFLAFTPRAPTWLGGGHPSIPRARTRLVGVLVGVGDWLFSSAALFVLLPHPRPANYPTFLAAYVAGSLLSALTGVPGGIGVFEAIILLLTSVLGQVHETAAALLLYRCIYSLGPLTIIGLFTAGRRLLAARGSPPPAGPPAQRR